MKLIAEILKLHAPVERFAWGKTQRVCAHCHGPGNWPVIWPCETVELIHKAHPQQKVEADRAVV